MGLLSGFPGAAVAVAAGAGAAGGGGAAEVDGAAMAVDELAEETPVTKVVKTFNDCQNKLERLFLECLDYYLLVKRGAGEKVKVKEKDR